MSEQIKKFFENLQADFPELKYRPGNTYADVRCKPATIISIRVVRGDVRIAFINQGGKYSCPKKDFNDWINESGILRKENPCGGYFEFSEGVKNSDKTQVSYLYSLESEEDLLKIEVQNKIKATYDFLKKAVIERFEFSTSENDTQLRNMNEENEHGMEEDFEATKIDRKRYFRVDFFGNGGEITIGSISENFVEYWSILDPESLANHLSNIEDGDPDSPDLKNDGEYYEPTDCNDLEYSNSIYSSELFEVTEILPNDINDFSTEDGVGWDECKIIKDTQQCGEIQNIVYSREFYIEEQRSESEETIEIIPCLIWHDKANYKINTIFIETNGDDFDARKIGVGVIETNVGDFVERIWYGKDEVFLHSNYDNEDFYTDEIIARVGYIKKYKSICNGPIQYGTEVAEGDLELWFEILEDIDK